MITVKSILGFFNLTQPFIANAIKSLFQELQTINQWKLDHYIKAYIKECLIIEFQFLSSYSWQSTLKGTFVFVLAYHFDLLTCFVGCHREPRSWRWPWWTWSSRCSRPSWGWCWWTDGKCPLKQHFVTFTFFILAEAAYNQSYFNLSTTATSPLKHITPVKMSSWRQPVNQQLTRCL